MSKRQRPDPNAPGYLYIVQTREFLNKKEPTYKVGRTANYKKRLHGYTKGSVMLFLSTVNQQLPAENALKALFKKHFTQRKEYGHESFTGDIVMMISLARTVACDFGGAEINLDKVKEEKTAKIEKKKAEITQAEQRRQYLEDEEFFKTTIVDTGENVDVMFKSGFSRSIKRAQIYINVLHEKNYPAQLPTCIYGKNATTSVSSAKVKVVRDVCVALNIEHCQDSRTRIPQSIISEIPIKLLKTVQRVFNMKRGALETDKERTDVLSRMFQIFSGFALVAELARNADGEVEYYKSTAARQKKRPKKRSFHWDETPMLELRPLHWNVEFRDRLKSYNQ